MGDRYEIEGEEIVEREVKPFWKRWRTSYRSERLDWC